QSGQRFSSMKRTIIGASACPPPMIRRFQETYGVHVLHAWGMTEMSPIGTVCAFKASHAVASAEARYALHETQGRASAEARYAVKAKQGRGVYGVDMKIVDASGAELPWDGNAAGDLLVR